MPENVNKNAKAYNIWRTEYAVKEAKKKLDYYQTKLEEQKRNPEILYNSPIQSEENK